ncbi:MAG: V/A-type H+-transporting ATPase subunit I [Candidatus Omnitrophota bacterium]|jgi:V/A-type H+-transporting ATPase subunit I
MIVDMKKIHLIVQAKDVSGALKKLRTIGHVHVEHQEDLKDAMLTEIREDITVLENVRRVLQEQKNDVPQVESDDLEARADLIMERLALVDELTESMDARKKHIDYWEQWGDFNPQDIRDLKDKGLHVELCELTKEEKSSFDKSVVVEAISQKGKKALSVLVSEEAINLPCEPIRLPQVGLKALQHKQCLDHERLAEARTKLKENARYINFVNENITELEDTLNFQEVKKGMRAEEELSVLKGFCPEESCAQLEDVAKNEQWALLVEDITEEDNPPTLLKNSKLVNLSKPALDVIEILPGYKELDVSAVFLIFFTLFFAMLIGDAAYGAIFAIGTVIAHIKLGKKMTDKTPFLLMYMLTGFTILWGVLTGTYFGQQWLPDSVQPVLPWLNEAVNVQWLCFTIALVHLTLARVWAAIVKLPSITFLSEIGWALIIWGMYFVANMFVLNKPLPVFATWFLMAGIPMALFFMFPPKEIKKVGQEVIPFVLGVIGAGTDIISYIRLFAVGLATVAVADAANSMPEALPGVGVGLMIFLHMLNLILAAMAILVHAIRLNVLEFSGHLGLEWVGSKYNPFKITKKNN